MFYFNLCINQKFLNILGVYNPSETIEYDESYSVKQFDFLSGLCIAWEDAATKVNEGSIRNVIIRSGISFNVFHELFTEYHILR